MQTRAAARWQGRNSTEATHVISATATRYMSRRNHAISAHEVHLVVILAKLPWWLMLYGFQIMVTATHEGERAGLMHPHGSKPKLTESMQCSNRQAGMEVQKLHQLLLEHKLIISTLSHVCNRSHCRPLYATRFQRCHNSPVQEQDHLPVAFDWAMILPA